LPPGLVTLAATPPIPRPSQPLPAPRSHPTMDITIYGWSTRSALNDSDLLRGAQAGASLRCRRRRYNSGIGLLPSGDPMRCADLDEVRRYVAGPGLRGATAPEPVADLRRIALPHLEALAARTEESVNLMVVVGDQARFVASVESARVLRVGDREGRILPAHL